MSLIKTKQNCCDPWSNFFDDNDSVGWSFLPVLGSKSFKGNNWLPALDVTEEKDTLVVKADLPGIKKEDVTLSVDGSVLTIRGERKSEEEQKDKKYYRIERSYGSFQRTLDLGVPIDQNKVRAQYKDGVLEVSIPKAPESKAKQIDIETT